MILNIPVNEAVEIIKAKTNKPINLRTVSANTINVGYDVNIKIPIIGYKSKTISIDIIIDRVVNTDLYIHSSTGIATGDSVIKALLSFLPAFNDSKVIDRQHDGHITVHLNEVNQLKELLEKVKVNSILFGQDSIIVDFTPKI